MDQPQTNEMLNELLARKASTFTEQDLLTLVAALRAQREQWHALQANGSRKRAPSSQVPTQKGLLKDLAGLKL
jgi:hypothetical protein